MVFEEVDDFFETRAPFDVPSHRPVEGLRGRRRREQVGSIPRDTWRAGRLLNALRKEIPGVSVLLSIARIPFMIAVAIAMLVGVFEVMLAPVVVATALISSVI